MERAIQISPEYIDAQIGLAYALVQLTGFGLRSGTDIYPQAKAALDKAMTLDPAQGRAYTLLGQLLWIQGDVTGCMAAHVKAVELSPNDGLVRTLYSWMLMAEGRFEEGIREGEIAVQLDPLSLFARCNIMGWYYADHRNKDALAEAQRILEIDSNWVPAIDMIGSIARLEGRMDEALSQGRKIWLKQYAIKVPDNLSLTEFTQWETTTLEKLFKQGLVNAGALAFHYTKICDKENALIWLEKATVTASPVILLLFYPEFDCLRDDPRFARFVEKIHLPVNAYCLLPADSASAVPAGN